MKGRGLLLLCGLFISYCVAQTPNRECHDLVSLGKNAESAFKLLGTLSCTPNANCTGITCSGTRKGKSFKGTVILQGCQKPVTLFVHWGNRHLLVKDGQKIDVWKNVFVDPRITKEGNVVHITLTLKMCATKKSLCVPIKLLDDQKVHVYCNGSKPITPDSPWIPKKPTDSIPPTRHPESKKGLQNTKRNCKGLNSAEESIERNFDLFRKYVYPGSTINCSPIANCTGLNCTGVVDKLGEKEHFTASAIVDYCSSPATLELRINVPKENMHFDNIFRDGDKVEVSKQFGGVFIVVHLKRLRNFINVTVTVETKFFTKDFVKNARFAIDPSHCHGHHSRHHDSPFNPTKPHAREGKSLSKGAIAVIIIASFIVVVLLAVVGVWLVKKKRLSPRPAFYNNVTMSDDTDPLYHDFEPDVA